MRILLLAITLQAAAQSPTDLIRQSLEASKSAKTAATRFTYFDLEHNQNRDVKGKLFSDRLTLYEDIYIADLPYKRVVELNGKPLTGDALAREQARFDEAVAQRKALDGAARAKLIHETLVDGGIHLSDLITPAYTLTELRKEMLPQLNGPPILTHVIEGKPTDTAHTKSYELWISDHNPTTLRMAFDVICDEAKMLHGTHGQTDYQLIDGIPVANHQVVRLYYPNNGKTITVDVEHTYTRYRRFNTSARIIEEATQPTPEP